MSPTDHLGRTLAGLPVYAIDDRQRVIRGIHGPSIGPMVAVDTTLRPRQGVTRRRWFHARFVTRDWWRDLEDLP